MEGVMSYAGLPYIQVSTVFMQMSCLMLYCGKQQASLKYSYVLTHNCFVMWYFVLLVLCGKECQAQSATWLSLMSVCGLSVAVSPLAMNVLLQFVRAEVAYSIQWLGYGLYWYWYWFIASILLHMQHWTCPICVIKFTVHSVR